MKRKGFPKIQRQAPQQVFPKKFPVIIPVKLNEDSRGNMQTSLQEALDIRI